MLAKDHGYFYRNEECTGKQIVISRFIDDSQLTMRRRVLISQRLIDFSPFK